MGVLIKVGSPRWWVGLAHGHTHTLATLSALSSEEFSLDLKTKPLQEIVMMTTGIDETAGNNLNGACIGGTVLVGDGTHWGMWSSYSLCPANSAICGLRTKVERNQGVSDDTSLNRLTLYCCAL